MKRLLLLLLPLLPLLGFGQAAGTAGFFNMARTQQPGSTPTISKNGSSFSAFSANFGSASTSQLATVSGFALVADVVVSADAGMEVSLDNSNFASTKTITKSGTSLPAQPVNFWTRITSTTIVGTGSGQIRLTSTGATEVDIAFNYTVNSTATLSASPTSLTGVGGVTGSSGTPQTTTITFSGTTITAAPPANTEVSKDGGANYVANPSTINFSTGSPLALKIRSTSTAPPGVISGNLHLSGSFVTAVDVSISGTVTSAAANDTVNTNVADSLGHSGASGTYTDLAWNNWRPVETSTASKTSALQKYSTGVQSPIGLTVDHLNDFAGNGPTYGTSNTAGYPQPTMVVSMYNTAGMVITWTGVSAGTYKVEVLSATAAGSGPFNQAFSIPGGTTANVNAFQTGTVTFANLVVIDNVSPVSGNIVMTVTPSNSFTVICALRLIRKN